jgi:hypothetical protein
MRLSAIVIFSLVVLGAIAQTDDEKDKQALEKIRKDPFGESILNSL